MDSTGEGIVLPTKIDLSGFSRGTKQLESAIKSLSNRVKSIGNTTERMASRMANPLKRLLPTILGVGSAYGIISKAVSAFMSQNEELSARMSSIWTALGNLLGPIITQIIDWVTTAVSYFLSFLKLLGVTSKSASQLSQKASGAAKELQRTLAGFDELNVLQDNSGGGGGGGGKGLEDVDPSEWMKKLADLLKNKMWDEAADMIIEKLNDIIYKVRDKAYDVGAKIGEYLQGIIHVISRVLNETDWKALGEGIGNFFMGLLKEVEGINFGYDLGKLLVAKFTIAFKILDGFLETDGLLGRIGNIFGEAIKGAFDAISEAIEGSNPAKIGQNIADFFNQIDWMGIADSLLRLLRNAWNFSVTLFHNVLTDTDWQAIGNSIGEFIRGIDWAQIAENIKTLLVDAWDAAWDLFLGVLGKGTENEAPIIKQLEDIKTAAEELARATKEALGPVWDDLLKPLLEWTKKSLLPEVLGEIKDSLNKLTETMTTFKNLWTGLKELLFGDTSTGWESLKNATQGYADVMARNMLPGFDLLLKTLGITVPTMDDLKTQMSGSAEEIKTSFSGMADKAKTSWEKFKNALDPEKVKERVAGRLREMKDSALTSFSTLREKTSEDWEAISDSIKTKVEDAKEKAVSAGENIKTSLKGAFEEISSSASQRLSGMAQDVSAKFNEIRSTISTSIENAVTSVSSGFSSMLSNIGMYLSEIGSGISSTFWSIIEAARSWGADLIQNFINGLADRVGALWESMKNIAQGIRDFIGFSEPKKGPLSNFHTFAPDMMDLYTKGIDQNKDKVLSAVGDLASGISNEMAGAKIGDGLELPTVDTSFASNVSYTPPVVAGGGFLPYNVGSQGMETVNGSEINSEILAAVLQLQEMITQFENSVENMQWVARFGNIRAVVEEITKIQKQADRARG